jgi:hypothetical protein
VRVYANLYDQKVPNVKAEITFGQIFPGWFEAILPDGEIRKTADSFAEKCGQKGIISLGENSADMIRSYGKTGTESRYIVSIQIKVEVTDIQEFLASSLVCFKSVLVTPGSINSGKGLQSSATKMYPIPRRNPREIIVPILFFILGNRVCSPVVESSNFRIKF